MADGTSPVVNLEGKRMAEASRFPALDKCQRDEMEHELRLIGEAFGQAMREFTIELDEAFTREREKK